MRACTALCISFSSPKSALLGWGIAGARLYWSISCPPLGALIEKFGWPCLFVLVECGGLCFFLWGFSSVPLLHRLWGESSLGGQAEPCLWSGTSLSPLWALCSLPHLVASSLLTGLLDHWFLHYGFCDPVRPGRTDGQRSSRPGNKATAQFEETSSALMVEVYLL